MKGSQILEKIQQLLKKKNKWIKTNKLKTDLRGKTELRQEKRTFKKW
jgi:hypothetical protein